MSQPFYTSPINFGLPLNDMSVLSLLRNYENLLMASQ
jgi:hypothetical protein